MKKSPHHLSSIDRLPPHSQEAEQGILGCLMLSPNGCITTAEQKLGREGEPFYDLRHRSVYQAIIGLHERNNPVDAITLGEELRKMQQLEAVGGHAFITALPEASPSALNLDYWLGIILEKFSLRRLITACTEVVGRCYEDDGNMSALVTRSQAEILGILNPISKSVTQEHWRIRDLIGYDVDHDPNAIVGWREGRTTRYLCRGYAAWLIGQSGIGKSSLGQQQCYLFALGRPFFGITPVRPLRCLIVQNENDQGDCAEATQGILDSGNFSKDEFTSLNDNVKIIRCRGKTGGAFCMWLEREVIAWKADLVYVDPLLRFAGIDVSKQDQCTKFLNDSMDPVLANTGVVMLGAHHTGKPKSQRDTKCWTIYDHAYSGIGSSELVNWARAISIVRVLGNGAFEMLLAKRGARAWATHPGENYATTSIYMEQDKTKIFWHQIQPPAESDPEPRRGSAGRKSKVDEIATSNLFEFCSHCLPEGEGLNVIAKRLEATLAKNRIDASSSTCKRVIPALVANGKLSKNDQSAYFKGPDA